MSELLAGSVEVPFPVVGAVIGLVILGTLVYLARRPRDEN